MLQKTVQIALEKGIIKPKSIIVDATHTKSRYNQNKPIQIPQEQSKKLHRPVYEVDESMKESFPSKNTEDSLEKELEYCRKLIDTIRQKEETCSYPKVREKINLQEEIIHYYIEHQKTPMDRYARTGHKTSETSFFDTRHI